MGQNRGAIHMVSAWATENRLVLGQKKVQAKSNEITAIRPKYRVRATKCSLPLKPLLYKGHRVRVLKF